MIEATNSIDTQRLVVLLCGPDGPTQGAVERLRDYVARGIAKPEIRRGPLVSPYFSVYKFDGSNLTGGRSSRVGPHDAFFEGLRSAGLPPLGPVRVPTMYDENFYSCDDAKAIAPYERQIAVLSPEFCRFAWGTEVDPAAVVMSIEVLQKSDDAAKERTYVTKRTVIKVLLPYCPTIESILKNASHKDYAWLAPARRAKGLKGWYLDVLVGLLVERELAKPDALAKLKEQEHGTVVGLESAMRRLPRRR